MSLGGIAKKWNGLEFLHEMDCDACHGSEHARWNVHFYRRFSHQWLMRFSRCGAVFFHVR